MSHPVPVPDTDVPPDETPAVRCPYCGRPFPNDHLRALHLGTVHAGEVDDGEREAHEAAVLEEDDELFLYHLKVIAALGAVYALMVVVYMIVLGGSG